MNLILDNLTQTVVQVAVSSILCVVMGIAWLTQKTYPGFGRWTVSKIPHALGWLLIGLRGLIPDWASVFVANGLLFATALLLYEGIRQFRAKPHRSRLHYGLMIVLLGAFGYFVWVNPNVNARLLIISGFTALVVGRCAFNLSVGVPRELRSSFWFTAAMFGLYDLVLLLRVVTAATLPALANPFNADAWQSVLFLTTIVIPIGWTFGFFMMTNDRLTSELRKAEQEMREMAATDFLTGALSRRAFIDSCQHEVERARRNGQAMALLVVDVDQFKMFNDTFGHPAGDKLLCQIVAACRTSLRASDLLGRWGGDEFAILLPDTGLDGGMQVAEKLRRTVLELTVLVDAAQAHAAISVGGALWMAGEKDWETVMRHADIALYQAKQHGRNCVVWNT